MTQTEMDNYLRIKNIEKLQDHYENCKKELRRIDGYINLLTFSELSKEDTDCIMAWYYHGKENADYVKKLLDL